MWINLSNLSMQLVPSKRMLVESEVCGPIEFLRAAAVQL